MSRQEPPGGTALLTVAGRAAVRGTRQDARSIGAAHWGLSPTPGMWAPLSLATTLRTRDSCRARHGRDPGLSAPGPETTRTNTLGFQGTRPPVCKNEGTASGQKAVLRKREGDTRERPHRDRNEDHLRLDHPQIGRGDGGVSELGDPRRVTPQWHSRQAAFAETERNPAEWPGTAGQAQTVLGARGDARGTGGDGAEEQQESTGGGRPAHGRA